MKKRLVSLLMALALCLSLLPATALAEGAPSGQVLYVGGVEISSAGYWTTDSNGSVTPYTEGGKPTDNYIHYDAENNVLTLHNATIKKSLPYSTDPPAGSYILGSAIGVFNQNGDAELTITLEGTNTIAEVGKGIYVLAISTGGATLTITGDGSLDASASQTGIWVQSNNGNGALFIQNAKVEATGTNTAGYGVNVQSSNSSTAALTVDGGSLTASGSPGILYDSIGSGTVPNTTALTISNSAIVDARGGGIGAGLLQDLKKVSPADDSVGIVFDGNEGTVYGDVTLQEDLEIAEGENLTIGENASLTVPEGKTLTNNGTVTTEEGGTLTNNGSLDCNHHFGGTATCTEKAKCDLCGAEFGDFLPHSLTKTEAKAPSCTEDGNEAYWTCGTCGKYFSDANGDTEIAKDSWIISAINHDWNDAVYTWSDDGSTCTATRTCKHDSDHTETAVATVTPAQTKAPTCTENGETTYTAVFEADWAMTQTKVLADIPATGHKLSKTEAKAPSCTEDGNEAYWTCGTCGKYFSDASGDTEIAKDSWILSPIGHDWNDAVYTWSDDGSTCTATRTCKHDSAHTETATATVTGAQTKAPTCTENGETTYTAVFEADWAMTQTKVLADIPATGHSLTKTEAKAPTCTEDGNQAYWTCGTCGKLFADAEGKTEITLADTVIPAAGHTLTKTEAKAATCTEAGNQAYWTCGTCGKLFADGEGKTEITLDSTVLPALGHDYKDGVCTRCNGKDPDYVPPTDPKAPAQTGETGNPVLWIFLMTLSLASIAVMTVLRRQKHRA